MGSLAIHGAQRGRAVASSFEFRGGQRSGRFQGHVASGWRFSTAAFKTLLVIIGGILSNVIMGDCHQPLH